jgi:hypothetical protein
VFAFELLVYLLRIDRQDQAWSSMVWALRGWRAALAWIALPLLGCLAVGVASGEWAMVVVMAGFIAQACAMILVVLLPFFVLAPAYLAADRPAVAARLRWPGWRPATLLLLLPVGTMLLAFAASMFGNWLVQAAVAVLYLLLIFCLLVAKLYWLNGAPLADAVASARRPRVFLPWLLLALRWEAWLPLLASVLLPAYAFLIIVAPMLEAQMVDCPDACGLLPLVHASRAMVAWWLADTVSLIGIFVFLTTWFRAAGDGRLLLQLGQVRGTPPQQR